MSRIYYKKGISEKKRKQKVVDEVQGRTSRIYFDG